MNQPPIYVSIVGGHTIDRAAFTLLLASFPGIEVITMEKQVRNKG